MRTVRAIATTVLGSAMALGLTVPTADAAQTQGDGLVNVMVGDITLKDTVDANVAAQVAANICGVEVGPVAVLAETVDKDGGTRTICHTDQGDVTITQNN